MSAENEKKKGNVGLGISDVMKSDFVPPPVTGIRFEETPLEYRTRRCRNTVEAGKILYEIRKWSEEDKKDTMVELVKLILRGSAYGEE